MSKEISPASTSVKPRIIIHGGAGAITRDNLPQDLYNAHKKSLLHILRTANGTLQSGGTALDVATLAVTLLENDPLFNSGHGAVFTTEGQIEAEASVMVSKGYQKRGVGVMGLRYVRHPITLAREMLVRGNDDNGGGAQSHVQLHGSEAERLAREWGVETCRPSDLWTKKRWDQHRSGIGLGTSRDEYEKARKQADLDHASVDGENETTCDAKEVSDPSWDGKEYVPQGTVGCVVLDADGTLCVATSTGGITNKLPGRIGDTPTLGAGFWAEQWTAENPFDRPHGMMYAPQLSQTVQTTTGQMPLTRLISGHLTDVLGDCLGGLVPVPVRDAISMIGEPLPQAQAASRPHAVAMSGTGNGDSFLRLSAVRTAAAMTRFSFPPLSLQWSVSRMAGPEGMLQQSAEDRFQTTGEGQGGIIGIEYSLGRGTVVADFNCGGMFRTWIDDEGKERLMVFRKEY